MALNDSPREVKFIKAAIEHVGPASGADVCAIPCVIVQESGRNFPVGAIDNGIGNPGNMQSHVDFTLNDPQGSTLQRVRNGTEGTASGDGLKGSVLGIAS